MEKLIYLYGENVAKWLDQEIQEMIENLNLDVDYVDDDDIRVAITTNVSEMSLYEEHQSEAMGNTIDLEVDHYETDRVFTIGINY